MGRGQCCLVRGFTQLASYLGGSGTAQWELSLVTQREFLKVDQFQVDHFHVNAKLEVRRTEN